MSAEIFNRVKKVVVEQLEVEDPGTVTPQASFADDLEVDYYDLVELVLALEKEFDIEIPNEDAQQLDTVQKAVDYIQCKILD